MPKKLAVNVAQALGANKPTSVDLVRLYIPNKDAKNQTIPGHQQWCERGLKILADCFGGATATPLHDGIWVNPTDESVVREGTVIVYSFIRALDFDIHLRKIRIFTHLFGRETGQGEVVIEFQNRLYRITEFDALPTSPPPELGVFQFSALGGRSGREPKK